MNGYEMEPRLLVGPLLLPSLPAWYCTSYDCLSFEFTKSVIVVYRLSSNCRRIAAKIDSINSVNSETIEQKYNKFVYFIIIIAAAEHDSKQPSVIKVAFHDTDTDILARIVARTSACRATSPTSSNCYSTDS